MFLIEDPRFAFLHVPAPFPQHRSLTRLSLALGVCWLLCAVLMGREDVGLSWALCPFTGHMPVLVPVPGCLIAMALCIIQYQVG